MICVFLLHQWGLTGLLSRGSGLPGADPGAGTGASSSAPLVGLALFVPVLMAITFAPALVLFHQVGVWQATRLN